jgi:cystathionine beta-lyase
MPYNFDLPIDRRNSDSAKWNWFDPDVLPMWVADMDFQSPEPIIRALRERAEHGVYGYAFGSRELSEILVERLRTRHHMEVLPEHLHYLPNIVVGLNVVTQAVGARGDGVLLMPPIYFPFFNAITAQERVVNDVPLLATRINGNLHYEMDIDALEAAITPQTKLLLFCNPHNPVGRVYTRAELERLADLCLRHDLIICSDEIHCDLVYQPESHISIASLAPEIAARTVTLIAPSKAFNLPGLGFGAAVVPNDDLRERISKIAWSTGEHAYSMGIVAATAAYGRGQPWLDELVVYLRGNRDALVEYVNMHLPGVATTCPEGTFLAWLDCRELGLENPNQFFLEKARVGLTDGAPFGKGGEGFVRLNFGCPRTTLVEGLERMKRAVNHE